MKEKVTMSTTKITNNESSHRDNNKMDVKTKCKQKIKEIVSSY